MGKITEEICKAAYPIAKKVYEKNISKDTAIDLLEKEFSMNRTSASDYIYVFQQLMDGRVYKRAQNAYSTHHRLENIYRDYGVERLQNALSALQQHIEYNEGITSSTRHSLRKIYGTFSKIAG